MLNQYTSTWTLSPWRSGDQWGSPVPLPFRHWIMGDEMRTAVWTRFHKQTGEYAWEALLPHWNAEDSSEVNYAHGCCGTVEEAQAAAMAAMAELMVPVTAATGEVTR